MLSSASLGQTFRRDQRPVGDLASPHGLDIFKHIRLSLLGHLLEHGSPHHRLYAVTANQDIARRLRSVGEPQFDRAFLAFLRV